MPSTGRPAGPGEHRRRLLVVVDHPVVERTVRLEVAHRRARRLGDRRQGADLVGHLLAQQRPAATSTGTRPKFARST